MYAYREIMILTDPQRLILRQPLPLLSGQAVEVLVVSDAVSSHLRPAEVSSPESWAKFLVQRDDLLAKYPNEIKDFQLNRPPLETSSFRDSFAGWLE
jgi:hypothetical protein